MKSRFGCVIPTAPFITYKGSSGRNRDDVGDPASHTVLTQRGEKSTNHSLDTHQIQLHHHRPVIRVSLCHPIGAHCPAGDINQCVNSAGLRYRFRQRRDVIAARDIGDKNVTPCFRCQGLKSIETSSNGHDVPRCRPQCPHRRSANTGACSCHQGAPRRGVSDHPLAQSIR